MSGNSWAFNNCLGNWIPRLNNVHMTKLHFVSYIPAKRPPVKQSALKRSMRNNCGIHIPNPKAHRKRSSDSPSLSKMNAYGLFSSLWKKKIFLYSSKLHIQTLHVTYFLSYKLSNRKSCTFQEMKLQKQRQLMREPSIKKSLENLNSTCIS